MMSLICTSCSKPKANLKCGICNNSLCKACTQFVDEDFFSYLPQIPELISHQTYCSGCYDTHVVPARDKYTEDMERAKDIMVFAKNQGKETRNIKRIEDPISVTGCAEEKEVIMRLAFRALVMGYNSLVDLETKSTKVQNGSYKKLIWAGVAVPTHVDPKKLIKDRSSWHNPN